MERLDAFAHRYRNVLAGLPLVLALVSTRGELELEVVTWPLAVVLVALGIALRAWASCHCWYPRRRPKVLAVTGPYGLVRHPLYIGNLFILAGATAASELAWLIPPAMGWALLVYNRVGRHEGRELLARYGDAWLRYRSQVPAWIPRLALSRPRSRPAAECGRRLLAMSLHQALNLLILVPFVVKELNPLGVWPHP